MPSFCYWFEPKVTLPADERTDCRLPGLKFQTHTMYDRKCNAVTGLSVVLSATLQEALHGIEHNDREAFENGMRGYLE